MRLRKSGFDLKLHIRSIFVSAYCFKKCSQPAGPSGPPWKILFFGSDDFSVASLKPLCAKYRTGTLISSLSVVSKAGTSVTKLCESEHLLCYDWPLKVNDIKAKYDIGMVVSFGSLIPKNIIHALPLGCVNVHASILPRWRGAAPIYHAIMNGDAETGVTVMRIQPYKFDVGEIVRQYRIPISPNETTSNLEVKLAYLGGQMLMECLRDLPRCIQMAVPQKAYGVTYAPKIYPSLSKIDWRTMTAENVYNHHRALNNVYPLITSWHGVRLKIYDVEAEANHFSRAEDSKEITSKSVINFLNNFKTDFTRTFQDIAGTVTYCKTNKTLIVICGDGNFVHIGKLKIAGKHISALDFYNGFMTKKPKEFWKFGLS